MDDIRVPALDNIGLVLQKCLNGEEVKKLIFLFKEHGVLPTRTQYSVGEQVIFNIFRHIREHTSGITVEHFKSVCRHKDFPGGSLVAELVCALASLPDASSQHIYRLLTSWNNLVDRRNEVLVFVGDKLPNLWNKLLCTQETSSRDWLLLLMAELTNTQRENLELLCKELKNIMSNSKAEVSDPLENAWQKRTEDNKEWLRNSYNLLMESRSLLEDVVKKIWPEEPGLILQTNWPSSILEKAHKEDSDQSKIDKFVKTAKLKLEQQGAKSEHERELKECLAWMNKNLVLIGRKKDDFAPLVTSHFPEQSELLKAWPFGISAECKKSGGVVVVEFIKSLRRALDGGAASDIKAERNLAVAGAAPKTTQGNPLENPAGGVVIEQPKSEAERQKEWLRDCHSKIRDSLAKLTPLIYQLFPDEGEKIIEDRDWSTLFVERLLQIEDTNELTTNVLLMKDLLGEASQENAPGQADETCRSLPMFTDSSRVKKDYAWLEKNKGMLESYSHRKMIFISDAFSKEKWYPQDKDGKDPRALMRKLMEHCKDNQTGDNVRHLINFLYQISQERPSGDSERENQVSTQDIVAVEFRVLPLRMGSLPRKAKVIKDPISLKMWTRSYGTREKEIGMFRKEGCKYYSEELDLTRGDTLVYRYFTSSGAEFLDKSSDSTLNRLLEIPKDGSEKKMVVYDYACMYGDVEIPGALYKLLPSVKNLQNYGKKEVEQIVTWMRSMKSNRFLKPRKPDLQLIRSTESENYVGAVIKWISKVLKQRSTSDKVFIGCTVAKALYRNNICEELLCSIFRLLNTGKLDDRGYDTLIEKLTIDLFPKTESGSFAELDQTFLGLFKNAHLTPQFLYAVPLYWIIVGKARNSNTSLREVELEEKCWLPNAASRDHWQEKKEDWKDKQKDLLKMKDEIVNLAALHPKILKTFCYFLTSESIVEFLKHMDYSTPLEYEFLFPMLDLSSIKDAGKLNKVLKMFKAQVEKYRGTSDGESGDETHSILTINKTVRNLPDSPFHEIITFCAEMACQFYIKQPDGDAKTELLKTVRLICRTLEFGDVDKGKVQAWNCLLLISWPDNIGRQEFLEVMRRVIKKKWDGKEEECVAFYVDNVMDKEMHNDLTGAFDSTAEQCFDKYLEEKQHAVSLVPEISLQM